MAMGTSSWMLGGALILLVLSSPSDVYGGSTPSAAPRSPLDDLCSSVAGGWYVLPNECVSVLCVDPSCRSARGWPELAVLGTRLAVVNATVTKAILESALAHAKDAKSRKVMRLCLHIYVDAVSRLQWAARSIAAGRYSGVPGVLEGVYSQVSVECTSFAGQVALPKESVEFSRMAHVVWAVVDMVQRSIG
ncbi:uncharacterized protein LOC123439311 [Hordeum vulgare subsp. vulgare]|uniref:Pectinesterase inhibitor domain-containing protein n=1 Tax=Hordeum vulgare subsp. vulgare TaxID=112509 RepID=A0A8I7B920_HORVV|nr:uncharacterized protein LOC123439311 [Hordeum vulgare subsp. vulgare]